jgi:hypothetical protein
VDEQQVDRHGCFSVRTLWPARSVDQTRDFALDYKSFRQAVDSSPAVSSYRQRGSQIRTRCLINTPHGEPLPCVS